MADTTWQTVNLAVTVEVPDDDPEYAAEVIVEKALLAAASVKQVRVRRDSVLIER